MVSFTNMIMGVLYLIIVGMIYWLLSWALDKINPPQPFRKVAEVLLILGAVVAVICILLNMVGVKVISW